MAGLVAQQQQDTGCGRWIQRIRRVYWFPFGSLLKHMDKVLDQG
jgi:hypothetical protein